MSLIQGIINKKHILLLGIPRTGSTWLGKILSHTMDYSYVHEPDNETQSFYAYYGKQNLDRFPILSKTATQEKYLELFQNAFHQGYITYDSTSNQLLKKWSKQSVNRVENELAEYGKNPIRDGLKTPFIVSHLFPKQLGNRNQRVIKSVHAILATRFILNHFPKANPLFLVRHPAAVVASLLRTKNKDIDRKIYDRPEIIDQHPILRSIHLNKQSIEFLAGLQIGIFYNEIATLLQEVENAKLITFEELANDSFQTAYDLYKHYEINWTEDVELFIGNSNRKGTGKETRRQTALQAVKWKKELTEQQIKEISLGYNFIGEQSLYSSF